MIFKQVVLGQQDIDMQNNVTEFFLCCCSVTVVLEPKKRKSLTASTSPPSKPILFVMKWKW